jgi:hypothetical protein
MPLVVGSADTLQPEQRCVYDHVMKLYDDFVGGLNPPPMRINIDGPAGTGKSYLIDMISVHLAISKLVIYCREIILIISILIITIYDSPGRRQ